MNRKLTVALVVVAALVAAGSGAALFTGQNGGGDAPAAADDAAAAVEQSTPTPQSNEPTDEPTDRTPTATETATATATPSDAVDEESDASSDDAASENTSTVERANEPPVAVAGDNRTVREWVRVHFDATASTDPDGSDANLTYQWVQVGGPRTDMAYADTAEAEILAPEVTKRTNYTFAVTVTDEAGATATDTVTITVRPPMLEGDTLSDDQRNGVDDSDTEQSPESSDDSSEANGGGSDGDAGDSGSNDSSAEDSGSDDSSADDADSETSRDDIAQTVFGSSFDSLGAEDAAAVEEFYLRHPDGDWDPSTVKTRDELAQERYGTDFDELGFDGRVDVQEAFDAQFGDTGGDVSKDEITQAKWPGYNFSDASAETAGQITELYDRQPWADKETQQVRTREQLAHRLYDAGPSKLTRDQRLEVERRYNNQFAN
jgi:hypothetical protein